MALRWATSRLTMKHFATCGLRAVSEDLVDLVERYYKAQGLFRTDDSPDPTYSEVLELDMGTVETSLAGPRRPQDRIPLTQMKQAFLNRSYTGSQPGRIRAECGGGQCDRPSSI